MDNCREIIADQAFRTNAELVDVLLKIIDSVDYGEENQLRLFHDLIPRRIFADYSWLRKLNFAEKEELFKRAISCVPSAVLLHHLSILYLHNNRLENAKELIAKSYSTPEWRMGEPLYSFKDT